MKPNKKSIFVTGGTGFLGSHFLLRQKLSDQVIYCLVRAEDEAHGRQRLSDAVQRAAASLYTVPGRHLESVRSVVGDIELEHCGVDAEKRRAIREAAGGHELEFWHFAASLNFEERRREHIHRQNVQGVQHALALAHELGCTRFIYTSTAYVAGCAEGRIEEKLHGSNLRFNNYYEESKSNAEQIVADFCCKNGMSFTILRPSIVIGVAATKKNAGTTTGLFGFVREIHRLSVATSGTNHAVRIEGDPDMPINFIPVDQVMDDIDYVRAAGFAAGPVYHLVARPHFRLSQVMDVIGELVDLRGLRVCRFPRSEQSTLERLIARKTEFYGSYLSGVKEFERCIPKTHDMSLADFRAYVVEIAKELKVAAVDHILERRLLEMDDGASVNAYSAAEGRKPAVVLVNTYGMPLDFWSRIIKRLGDRFSFYTWESRGVPSDLGDYDVAKATPDRHAEDCIRVMDHFGLESAHLVGWCTGANITLRVAGRWPQRVRSISLLNGAYPADDESFNTEYNRVLRKTTGLIAANPQLAKLFHRLIFVRSDEHKGEVRDLDAAFATIDPDLVHLTSLPYRTPDHLYRYAVMVQLFQHERGFARFKDVQVPALVITGAQDKSVCPSTSAEIARLLPNSEFQNLRDADHFALYQRSEQISDAIRDFIGRQSA